MQLDRLNVYVENLDARINNDKVWLVNNNHRGGRSIISHKEYQKHHPRPVTNLKLTPWVAERRARRNMHREQRARKEKSVG